MSTLARFRKANGLLQLIRLIETSEPEKRKQLLSLIAKEDPGWASMVQAKALSFARVLTWPDDILTKVFAQIPASLIAALIQIADGEQAHKINHCAPRRLRKEIDQLNRDRRYTRDEKTVAVTRLLTVIRDLQDQRVLIFSGFDPALDIDLRLAG